MSLDQIFPIRRQALPAIAVGHIIIAVVMVMNGTTGARLHVAFPVLNRSSFGFWFSYFSVISRVVLSMFWFGIQSYTGSEYVYQVCSLRFASLLQLICVHPDVKIYLAKYSTYTQPYPCELSHHHLRCDLKELRVFGRIS